MRSKSFAERIADVLIEDGLLLPSQLEEAVGLQQKEGGRLLKILTDKQFVTDQDMTVSMGRCLNTPLINLAKLRVPEEVMALVPRDMAKANKLVPIARLNGKLFVAMADPTNVLAVDDIAVMTGYEVRPAVASATDIEFVLERIERLIDRIGVQRHHARDDARRIEQLAPGRLVRFVPCCAVGAHDGRSHVANLEEARAAERLDPLVVAERAVPGIGDGDQLAAGSALSLSTTQLVGVLLIALLTWTNTRGLEYGRIIQNLFTTAKTGALPPPIISSPAGA